MAIINQKPSYWVTVRDNFWNFLQAEDGAARMYEGDVYRSPVVKSIGITGTVAEGNVYASGLVYDYTRQVQGAEIALDAVALEHSLIDKATGATAVDGFVYDSSSDIGKEFAFGYYLEQRDGNYVYYWHPRCQLTQNDESVETSTDSATEPSRAFTIRALPTSEGVWRIRYYTKDADEPLTPEEFFAYARYTEKPQALSVEFSGDVVSGSSVGVTINYSSAEAPASPEISYTWMIANEETLGQFVQLEGQTGATFDVDPNLVGSLLKCVVVVSGSALGYVETIPEEITGQ